MGLSDDFEICRLFNEAESGTETPLCYFWHLGGERHQVAHVLFLVPVAPGTFFAASPKIEHRKIWGFAPLAKDVWTKVVWTRLSEGFRV